MVYIHKRECVVPARKEPFDKSQLRWFLPWHGHAYKCTREDFFRLGSIAPLYHLPRYFDPKWTWEQHQLYPPRWQCGWILDDLHLAEFALRNQLAVKYDNPPESFSYVKNDEERRCIQMMASINMCITTEAVIKQLSTVSGIPLELDKSYTMYGVGIRVGAARIFAFYDNYHMPGSHSKRRAIIAALIRFLFSAEGEEYRKLFYIPQDDPQPLWYPAMSGCHWSRSFPKS